SQGANVLGVDITPCNSFPCTFTIGKQYTVRVGFAATTDIWGGSVVANSIYNGVTKALRLRDPVLCNHLIPPCPVRTGRSYVFSYTGTISWKIPDPIYAEKPRSTVQLFHPYWESSAVRFSRNSEESRTCDLSASSLNTTIKIYLQWQLVNQYTWPFLCIQFPVKFIEEKANSANVPPNHHSKTR
ncbi:hypothetical protein T265_14011, partial [Opisthorchis viverrini]